MYQVQRDLSCHHILARATHKLDAVFATQTLFHHMMHLPHDCGFGIASQADRELLKVRMSTWATLCAFPGVARTLRACVNNSGVAR